MLQYAQPETIMSNVESGRCVSLLMERTLGTYRSDRIRIIPIAPEIASSIVAAAPKKAFQRPVMSLMIRHMSELLAEERTRGL